ncbi:MAG: hypothetical protein WAP35_01825, partial [Solirubrobacterales bacterium]
MTDELLYQRMSLSFSETLLPIPRVHGEFVEYYGILYPLLIAPLQWFDIKTTFELTHIVNGVIMASAAFPAFLLARAARLSKLATIFATVISTFIPWTVFTVFMLTEVAAYPAFLWGTLAIWHCISNRGPRADLIAIAGIILAFSARTQFAFLALVLPASILLHEAAWAVRSADGDRSYWRRIAASVAQAVRDHRLLACIAGAGALALIVLQLTGGATRIFGAYGAAFDDGLWPDGTGQATREMLGYVAISIGVLPLVGWIAWVAASAWKPDDKGVHALATLSFVSVAAIMLVTGAFNMRATGLIEDRYAFYVTPLMVIGTLAFLERPRWRTPALAIAALVSTWALLSFTTTHGRTFTWIGNINAKYVEWAAELDGMVGRPGVSSGVLIATATLVATLVLWLLLRSGCQRMAFLAVACLVTIACVGQTVRGLHDATSPMIELDRGQEWVDSRVDKDAVVAVVPTPIGDRISSLGTWWDTEFWNRRVRRQWLAQPSLSTTPFRSDALTFDPDTGIIPLGDPVTHVVTAISTARLQVAGKRVAVQRSLQLI